MNSYTEIFKPDTLLKEIAVKYQSRYNSKIVAAIVDSEIYDLQSPIGNYKTFGFIELNSILGNNIYHRSVLFLLVIAVQKLYPEADVIARYTVNKGLYCSIEIEDGFTLNMKTKIEEHMRHLIEQKKPIKKIITKKEDALRLFKEKKLIAKANLINSMKNDDDVSLYVCDCCYDYLYGVMLDNTSELGNFKIDYYSNGVLLKLPEPELNYQISSSIKQTKLESALELSEKEASMLECEYVSDLNRYVRNNKTGNLIRVSEALHGKKISKIADEIANNVNQRHLILIAGPSSSGKTSFSQRLKVELEANNIHAISISMDDYFVNRKDTPLTPTGEYDYESIDALDVSLLNYHLKQLLSGKEVSLPRYNFVTGEREKEPATTISMGNNKLIIIEGIHALNEQLTSSIPRGEKYKIYVSALTPLNLDMHNRIKTTNMRLVRRMVRDYKYRGALPLKTLQQWPIVRAGEEKNIFPFQEDADVVFNSSLIYEMAALKKYIIPILQKVPSDIPEYSVVREIINFCNYFEELKNEDDIPNDSIIREFISGSCFFDDKGNLKE